MANKCIITGATGYIGSHVLKYMLSKGWEVHIIADPKFGYDNIKDSIGKIDIFEYDGDILSLCDYFQKTQADVVYHLAAAVITNYKPEQVPILIQSNIQFGTEILEAMKQSNTKLIVSTGSYWQNYNSDDYNPVDLYAATKEAFEKIIKYYTEAEGIRAITLRLYDVYGTNDLRPKLWNTIKKIAGTDEVLNLSPGEQRLDMIFISDVCTAYEKAFSLLIENKNVKNETYGVYSGNRMSLKEIVELYRTLLDKPVNIVYGGKPYKTREVMEPTSRLLVLPGWLPAVSIEEGLVKILKG
jgi:CDP-3, 6-dideoxy-D-glycero-L-glycero-4-hexulose-4-reductase